MKINSFQGDLTDVSAGTEVLVVSLYDLETKVTCSGLRHSDFARLLSNNAPTEAVFKLMYQTLVALILISFLNQLCFVN